MFSLIFFSIFDKFTNWNYLNIKITMTCSYLPQIATIKENHLPYIEKDLEPYEIVSLGFLLYGDDNKQASYILQKLLLYLANPNELANPNILKKYAEINRNRSWTKDLIEALAIIGAKRVLRKLGFKWDDLLDLFPNQAEIAVGIHPLLKAFYIMSEALTPDQAKEMILDISNSNILLKDYSYLELFLLDWLSRGIIKIGNKNSLYRDDIDIQKLLSYFELKEMDSIKELLKRVISHNANVKERVPVGNSCKDVGDDLANRYLIRREKAGFVLIFNQVKFDGQFREREGSDLDKFRIAELFQSFGYYIKPYDNLKQQEIKKKISKYVLHSKDYDSLVVVILSHGHDGLIYGSDCIPIPIDEIQHMLCSPLLEKKPKMLFIQACQNEDEKNQTNESLKKNVVAKDKASQNAPAKYADTIRGMATIPGYVSFRLTRKGSWYIQSLCDVIERIGDKDEIVKILTETTNDVLNRKGAKDEIMLPTYTSTLTKSLYLPPRKRSS